MPPSSKRMQKKTPSTNHPAQLAAQHMLHSTKASAISKPERDLHAMCAQALLSVLSGQQQLQNLEITVSLPDISAILMDHRTKVEQRKKASDELNLILWEERFTDYVAFALSNIKKAKAWNEVEGLADLTWVEVKEYLDGLQGTLTTRDIRLALRSAANEAGLSYRTAHIAIDVYAERCRGQRYHDDSSTLLRQGRFEELAKKLLDDHSELPLVTPRSHQRTVAAITECLALYQSTYFERVKSDGSFTLTDEGKKFEAKANKKMTV